MFWGKDRLTLEGIAGQIATLSQQSATWRNTMIEAMRRLEASVRKNTELDASVVTLLKGLSEQIRHLEPTKAAIIKLADEVDAATEAMSTAVGENTPQTTLPERGQPVE